MSRLSDIFRRLASNRHLTLDAIRVYLGAGLFFRGLALLLTDTGLQQLTGGAAPSFTTSGVAMAIFMSNAGGAWDNAKKYIEGGAHGGKGSEPHKAAVVGDTVGDPFKDTSGPSLNILIKLMSVVALVLAPWFARVHAAEPEVSTFMDGLRQLLGAVFG